MSDDTVQPAGTLYQRTLQLLRDSNQTAVEIHIVTRIPFHWITKFATGAIPDPGVNRVQKLYEHLAGQSLEV